MGEDTYDRHLRQAMQDERERIAQDDACDYPAHIMGSMAEWLFANPDLRDSQGVAVMEMAQEVFATPRAIDLIEMFQRHGGAHWQHARALIMDSVPESRLLDAAEDMMRYDAELAETEASLMPGRA